MKPRFPLSVDRHFAYRARIIETGEVIECESFKTLYYCVRSALRTEVTHPLDFEFSSVSAVFEYGYETSYEIRKGYFYSEFTVIYNYGLLTVSAKSENFCTIPDHKQYIIKGV